MRLHKWSRPRWKSLPDEPVCLVCGLQSSLYNFCIDTPQGRIRMGWISDTGEVWGSHVPIQYARAGLFCKGENANAD